MADFTIIDETTENQLFAETPDDVDEMKIYIDGEHTVYLKTEDRRRLIDFLIRHTGSGEASDWRPLFVERVLEVNESIEKAVRRTERATNGSIAMMIEAGIKAGLATRDVLGTIHYLVPLKFRMACGRRPEDSYSSTSFWERVTCAKCLEHKSHYGATANCEIHGDACAGDRAPHNADHGVPVCYCDGAGRHVHGSNCPPLAVSEDEAQRSEVPEPHNADHVSDQDDMNTRPEGVGQ